MLMGIGQSIKPWAEQFRCTIRRFHLCNHFFAAAAVTGHRKALHRIICRQQTKLHHRIDQGSKSTGIAARYRNSLRSADLFPMRCGQLRKTIRPIRIGTMCGRSIDDFHIWIFHQRHRFSCCCVRQAEKGNITLIDVFFPFLRILSLFRINLHQFNIGSVCKAL